MLRVAGGLSRFPEVHLLLTVHDELVFEVPEAEVDDFPTGLKAKWNPPMSYACRSSWTCTRGFVGRRPLTLLLLAAWDRLVALGAAALLVRGPTDGFGGLAFKLNGLRLGRKNGVAFGEHLALQDPRTSCG